MDEVHWTILACIFSWQHAGQGSYIAVRTMTTLVRSLMYIYLLFLAYVALALRLSTCFVALSSPFFLFI